MSDKITFREFTDSAAAVVRDMDKPGEVLDHFIPAAVLIGTGTWMVLADPPVLVAAALGAAAIGVLNNLIGLAQAALDRLVSRRPWYGIGRTIYHCTLGACEVVDFDDRDELVEVWVLIRATEFDPEAPPVLWVRGGAVAKVEAELHTGEGL